MFIGVFIYFYYRTFLSQIFIWTLKKKNLNATTFCHIYLFIFLDIVKSKCFYTFYFLNQKVYGI